MAIRLLRDAAVRAVRESSQFRSLTRRLEAESVRTARAIAGQRVERKTGVYEAGFDARFVPAVTQLSLGRLRLENKAPYAQIIEKGSRPHRIRVRNARVLYDSETDTVFGTEVNHPGTKAQNVIRDALLRVVNGRIR